ncbi:hypothetical protein RFI_28483 [Reticulomyxa filosa]|uniref:CCHC-type domain-containing protein n=1 Tax=Reticulomyxa filosa TaxID=46433 RepID=X6M4T5_RETFI|nr:hypothetical protein RFI_28483 [Reticulomyxa filosa]|eukprot:ETO08904.1 hypothetical protein RFI_28483 [Reticulomyxa filosa]
MPIVKVMLSKTEDVIKILKDIQKPFDKNKSRPKSHFKQCRNCYRLNHIARECTKKHKVCKYCGLANHETAKCRNKNDPSKHKYVLCRGQYPSDSVQCEVIRKDREKLGIKLTRKEDVSLKKKDLKQFLLNQMCSNKPRITLILMLRKDKD